eukprot:g7659.t2
MPGQQIRKEREWELGLITEAALREGGPSTEKPFYSYRLFRSICGEFIGSMLFLFFVITTARFADFDNDFTAAHMLVSGAFGLAIFVLVYIMADVSGAHLNPAVSIGLLVGKRISIERFLIYVPTQLAGAIAGAAIATTFLSSTAGGANEIAEGVAVADAFGGEVLCTFLLMITVFSACDGELARKNSGAPLLPFVIGMAVLLAHLVLIPIDGCSINPARTFATSVTNNSWDDHWVFWVGPLLGGVLGTVVWEAVLRPDQPIVEETKPIVQAASRSRHVDGRSEGSTRVHEAAAPSGSGGSRRAAAVIHPLPNLKWEVAGQGCGARASKEARFVSSPSSSCSSGRSIVTKAGGAQQEQCRARGASSAAAAGAGQGAEMAVTPKHAGSGGGGSGRVCGGAATTTSTTGRRWLWTAAAMTAVTAVTATVSTASATPCNPDATISPPASSPSAASLAGGRRGREGAGCVGGCDQRQAEGERGGAPLEEEAATAAARKSSWRSSLSDSAAAAPAPASASASSGQGIVASAAERTAAVAVAAVAAAQVAAAETAGNDHRPTRQRRESPRGSRASFSPFSWLDAGGFLLRRGAASALDLRGGARAMSAPATGGGGGGKSGGRDKKAKAGGAAGKDDGDAAGGGGGESRGRSVPLAGRPLFTSVASTKGHRPHMEDEFFLSSDGSFSAVYDGHGGANVSEYLRRNLYKHVMDHLPPGDGVYGLSTVEDALRAAFKCADDYVVTQTPYGNEGSCAVSVTVHCDREGKVSIISCNLGDSRAVLSRGGKALDLTEDHKPNAPREMERIYRHDGMVTWEGFECSQGLQIEGTGVYRINGNLAVARAIGDIDYRPWVSAEVEIKTIELKREADQFVILASDGLWDVMSSEEAVQYVHAVMGGAMGSGKEGDKWSGGGNGDKQGAAAEAGGDKPPHMTLVNWTQSYAEDRGMIRAATMLRKKKMAGYLAEEALRRGSMDNTTVAIETERFRRGTRERASGRWGEVEYGRRPYEDW